MTSSSNFLSGVVDAWSKVLPTLAKVAPTSTVKWQQDRTALGIEIKTERHLALVQAWDNAQSLDVTLLNVTTDTSTMLSAGPCPSDHEVAARLDQLRRALLDATYA